MVSIIMGSDSDLPVMQKAADILKELSVPYTITIVSAHRTPNPPSHSHSHCHSHCHSQSHSDPRE